MASMLRPQLRPDCSRGLLVAEHFQMAYATNDIDQAQALFADRYGITRWQGLEGQLKDGGHIRVELAWVGTLMYELLTASGSGSAIYMNRLPADAGFHIRHHHLGYLLNDGEWQALMTEIEAKGHAMPHISLNEGFMKSCFVDAPELGHYLEYICPEQAGLDFFNAVPGN
jgi:extradiol dioxygenase family protein